MVARLYHGAWLVTNTVSGIQAFETLVGGGVHEGVAVRGSRLPDGPPGASTLLTYRTAGYIPFIDLSALPTQANFNIKDPTGAAATYDQKTVEGWMGDDVNFRLKDAAGHTWNLPSLAGNGTAGDKTYFDGLIDAYATTLSGYSPNPMFFCPLREQNGFWYAWSENTKHAGHYINGNTAGTYNTAYQYIITRMKAKYTALGKTWNLTLVWCPDVIVSANAGGIANSTSHTAYAAVYPGDAYVDWRGIDGYGRSTTDTFTLLFGGAIDLMNTGAGGGITGSTACGVGKPIFIKETSTKDTDTTHVRQPNFIASIDSATDADTYPDVRGIGWYDIAGTGDPLDKNATSIANYRTMLARTTNPGNAFATLSGTPIVALDAGGAPPPPPPVGTLTRGFATRTLAGRTLATRVYPGRNYPVSE